MTLKRLNNYGEVVPVPIGDFDERCWETPTHVSTVTCRMGDHDSLRVTNENQIFVGERYKLITKSGINKYQDGIVDIIRILEINDEREIIFEVIGDIDPEYTSRCSIYFCALSCCNSCAYSSLVYDDRDKYYKFLGRLLDAHRKNEEESVSRKIPDSISFVSA